MKITKDFLRKLIIENLEEMSEGPEPEAAPSPNMPSGISGMEGKAVYSNLMQAWEALTPQQRKSVLPHLMKQVGASDKGEDPGASRDRINKQLRISRLTED